MDAARIPILQNGHLCSEIREDANPAARIEAIRGDSGR
jgi:hypothetical protein